MNALSKNFEIYLLKYIEEKYPNKLQAQAAVMGAKFAEGFFGKDVNERDRLAEINKILSDAVEKCVAMEGLTFAECSDAEFIMETLKAALAKAKEMGND